MTKKFYSRKQHNIDQAEKKSLYFCLDVFVQFEKKFALWNYLSFVKKNF